MDRRKFLTRLPAVAASVVAGCIAGGDGGTPTPTAEPTPTVSPTPTAAAASAREQFPDYTWSKLEGVEPTATSEITMVGFEFEPLVTAVQPGTEVTVTNEDSTGHTFTAPRLGIDEGVGGGETISLTVDRTGTFDYVCTIHPPGMLGRLVVTEEIPTSTPSPTATPTPEFERTVGQQAYLDYNWEQLDAASAVATTEIEMVDVAFEPLIAEVPVGERVSVPNRDSFAHTLTIPKLDIDERVEGGASTSVTFDEPGTYDYVCTIHPPDMLGRVIAVEEARATPAPTGTATATPTATPTPTSTPTPTPTPTDDGGGYY